MASVYAIRRLGHCFEHVIQRKTITASYQSLEGCGFDPRLSLTNRFLKFELEERQRIVRNIINFPDADCM